MLPRIAIIIVNWNGKADTLECLASLRQDTYANKEIIVVDNGSQDDSVVSIRATFPDITVLETGKNLGFTGGNNAGIRYALERSVDYVYLLNNDTTVEPDALTALVEAAQANPKYGLLTPVIHYFDRPEEAWFAGSRIDLTRGIAVHDNSQVPERTDAPREIPWASGCAMLIRADLIQRLGEFDHRYFLNWEDVDLSLRIRANGLKIGIVPAARIYHKVSRSFAVASNIGRYYHFRNHLLLLSIHSGSSYVRAALGIILSRFRETIRDVRHRHIGAGAASVCFGRALRDHLVRKYGPLHHTWKRL